MELKWILEDMFGHKFSGKTLGFFNLLKFCDDDARI